MLTPTHRSTQSGFILDTEEGVISANAAVRYCKVTFNREAYSDAEFARHDLQHVDHLHRAVVKRKAEYLAGRYCCAQLLEQYGSSREVGKNSDRSPCWPRGITGTISHGDNQAIAIITDQANVYPGVDIETFNPAVLREIADSIVSPAEAKWLNTFSLNTLSLKTLAIKTLTINSDFALLLAFSAKESLFKALYPLVKVFFGFEYAVVESINAAENSFVLALTQDINNDYPRGMRFSGEYLFDGKNILTLIIFHQEVYK
ncbi:4'-phosphopantetheinyl transferase superfamily protein [Rouxiella sp. T17]|uniref:4'-phosphopantetheinyl transferase family protein n=1 Tax=Rouxiella sp. T17 TaxID=3085684 RepID=UPI002FC9B8A4